MTRIFARILTVAVCVVCVASCATQAADEQRAALAGLADELAEQRRNLVALGEEVQTVSGRQQDVLEALEAQRSADDDARETLAAVAAQVRRACEAPPALPQTPAAPAGAAVRTVVVQGDKMVLGQVERVWIDPPGFLVTARVDTGADSNSIHAEDLVEFERDGEEWVRFRVFNDQGKEGEGIEVERRIVRHVRVIQSSNPEGERRPVVELRAIVGDIQGNFEFTLADRSHLGEEVLLARNFLTDVAVVDVSRSFVQKPYEPSAEQGGAN